MFFGFLKEVEIIAIVSGVRDNKRLGDRLEERGVRVEKS